MGKRYGAIDGLRTIAAVGIVMVHVRGNTSYEITGFAYNSVILSFANFVFLFMTISAFGMCCGYYEKILKNQISIVDFYKKRFLKILPFFAILVTADLIVSPSIGAVYEGFADLTLLFGLLPNPGIISVIGVGWFIGLVFVFYLCFPFFCCLLENKRRAWISFGISLIYNFVCTRYFGVGRTNILYSACFFLAGGLIYLYREPLAKINRWIMLPIVAAVVTLYYIIGWNTATSLLVSAVLLIYATIARGGVLDNKIMRFFGGISMEIYLSHMLVFRVIEKLHLHTILGGGWIQYAATVVMALVGTTAFAFVMQKILLFIESKITKYITGKRKHESTDH